MSQQNYDGTRIEDTGTQRHPLELWPGVPDGKVLVMTLRLESDQSELGKVYLAGKGDGTTDWPAHQRAQYWAWSSGGWPTADFYCTGATLDDQSTLSPPSGVTPYHEKDLDSSNQGSQPIGVGSFAVYKDSSATVLQGYLVHRTDAQTKKPYIRVLSVQSSPGTSLLTTHTGSFRYVATQITQITYTAATYDGVIE